MWGECLVKEIYEEKRMKERRNERKKNEGKSEMPMEVASRSVTEGWIIIRNQVRF